MVDIPTLAAFKRFLAMPGATVQVIRNDWMTGPYAIKAKPGYFDPKTIATVQSNSVRFSSGSWLAFPKASHIRFNGDTATLCMNQDGSFSQVLVYKLSLQGEP